MLYKSGAFVFYKQNALFWSKSSLSMSSYVCVDLSMKHLFSILLDQYTRLSIHEKLY